jgi:hypothetical protein
VSLGLGGRVVPPLEIVGTHLIIEWVLELLAFQIPTGLFGWGK